VGERGEVGLQVEHRCPTRDLGGVVADPPERATDARTDVRDLVGLDDHWRFGLVERCGATRGGSRHRTRNGDQRSTGRQHGEHGRALTARRAHQIGEPREHGVVGPVEMVGERFDVDPSQRDVAGTLLVAHLPDQAEIVAQQGFGVVGSNRCRRPAGTELAVCDDDGAAAGGDDVVVHWNPRVVPVIGTNGRRLEDSLPIRIRLHGPRSGPSISPGQPRQPCSSSTSRRPIDTTSSSS
jgi:hypothetical protein